MKSVLFVASEGLPFIKTGGLADVIGSLPKILVNRGYDVRVVLPLYQGIIDKHFEKLEKFSTVQVRSGWINQPASYYYSNVDGVKYYFVEHQGYFERSSLYGYADDGERFSFFQRAALDLLYVIDWFPEIIHTHDWHTGMIPLMCKACYQDERYNNIKHIYTIHNLAFQGNFPSEMLESCLGIDWHYYTNGDVRFHSGISFMKSGIVFANKVTTVSLTYSNEILTEEYGENLQEVLKLRQHDLWGIVNGIDTDDWNPSTDKLLACNYDINNYVEGKKQNKISLQKELGLNVDENVMLIGLVSRLTWQKGIYQICEQFKNIMDLNVQFVVLGSGEKQAEDSFKWLEDNYKGRAVFYCGYNEELAHRIYAGCDVFLMPSLYEPCGIGQLIALRYGSLPLVRETGGLKDTVIPYNIFTGDGNGFSFNSKNSNDMFNVLKWASEQYYYNKHGFNGLIQNALNSDVSWMHSGDLYERLYYSI